MLATNLKNTLGKLATEVFTRLLLIQKLHNLNNIYSHILDKALQIFSEFLSHYIVFNSL